MNETATPILEARNLTKHFPVKRGVFAKTLGVVRAVDGVNFSVSPGQTLGLVGESGCGKTTTAKLVLRLEEPTGGGLRFEGRDIGGLRGSDVKEYRRSVQAVFQDPFASLNPRMRVDAIIAEPLTTHERLDAPEVAKRVSRLLELVGLPERAAKLFPHEFSGGQRQRIAIARSLALSPRLVVLDEPVSALDVSIRAQILNLLRDLQAQLGLSYLFIAHDLAAVAHMSHTIAVMYLGQIVEIGDAATIATRPRHPVHAGPLRGGSALTSVGAARGAGAHRRGAEPAQSPAGLPLPPALPARDAPLLERGAGAARARRPAGGLPPLRGARVELGGGLRPPSEPPPKKTGSAGFARARTWTSLSPGLTPGARSALSDGRPRWARRPRGFPAGRARGLPRARAR